MDGSIMTKKVLNRELSIDRVFKTLIDLIAWRFTYAIAIARTIHLCEIVKYTMKIKALIASSIE